MKNVINNFLQQDMIDAYNYFGAHLTDDGVTFTVYAPTAYKVSVAGDFNNWNYRDKYMKKVDINGVFSIHINNLEEWSTYKYGIFSNDNDYVEKSDPFGFYHEERPNNASKVVSINNSVFTDDKWMKKRTNNYDKPLNIYELHLGSWIDDKNITYDSLADRLADYIIDMGYTHVELMPINEHPFDGSWGYQATGFYSVTSRYGSIDQFKSFVNKLHLRNIGVILDIVPAHFVKDSHGLAKFDGSLMFEMEVESEWGTLYFDYGKEFVRNFFMSSVFYFINYFHIDGVRMDAVSNLIYYQGNKDKGTNDNAISFLKTMNSLIKKHHPNVMLIAEDSSDYGKVTESVDNGGLGFDYKWDLGWMNDTLKYYELDPLYKKDSHHKLTFSMAYFYYERFILPLSHDEVVHGKKTVIDKMWGDYSQKFSLAKNLYLYMFTHPGKKLNFMGNELAHFREWDEKKPLDWFLLDYPVHDSFKRYMRDLNNIYLHHSSLSLNDYKFDGFKWIDADNISQSIYVYIREAKEELLLIVLNMTGQSFEEYDIGVPEKGEYLELINTEKSIYSGCDMTNYNVISTFEKNTHNCSNTIKIRIAPFAGIIFKHQK